MEDLEKQEILEIISKNSGVTYDNLSESTNVDDVSDTEEIVGKIIQEKYTSSLGYQICNVQPLNGPYGKIFCMKKQDDNNFIEVISKEVNTKTFTVSSGYTLEAYQDMMAMFNKSTKRSALKTLSGLSHKDENRTIMNLLLAESTTKPALAVVDSDNLESVLLQLSKRVSESVIEMNHDYYKTLDSFCVLSGKWASAVLGSFDFMSEGNEKELFIGRIGRTDYYINPFLNTSSQFTDDFDYGYEIGDTELDYCYIGLVSKTPGQGSLSFHPYNYESQFFITPDYNDGAGNLVISTGDLNLIIRNRYGIITSPLHDPLNNRSMLHKFAISGV